MSTAAEWSLRGNVFQQLGYDDNVRMNPTNAQGSFQYKIIPSISFQHKTDVSEVSANASYGTQIFTEIPQFDQDIQNYGVNGLYKTNRIDWGLGFNYSVTPSRNTAIQDSGDFTNSPDKTTWTISPTMTYKLSMIDNLILGASFSESAFSQSNNTSNANNLIVGSNGFAFQDNSTKNFNLGWQRLWSERYTSDLSLFYSNYEFGSAASNNGFPSTNDSFGFNFANNYKWSENWNMEAAVGVRHSISSGGQNIPESSSTGFLANIGAHYTAESYHAGVTFFRSLLPSNFGQLQELTGTTLNFNYKLDERLSVGLDMSYQDSNAVNQINGAQERQNIIVHPAVNWLIAKDWTLSASYRFRTQDQTGVFLGNANSTSRSADSNFFLLSVNYSWPGLNLSR